jgi:hypothetical protein
MRLVITVPQCGTINRARARLMPVENNHFALLIVAGGDSAPIQPRQPPDSRSNCDRTLMNKLKLTKERQGRFLDALANTGSVTAAIAVANTSRTRVYELRKADPAFASAWQEAEEIATDRLEDEARRRAVEGIAEPVVSAGKLVRDDDGKPILVRRYSDNLLLALLKARRPPRRERSVRFQLPALRSAVDAASAMAALTAGVGAGEVTPGEAAELSKLVEAYVKALEAGEFDQRLRAVEARNDATRR